MSVRFFLVLTSLLLLAACGTTAPQSPVLADAYAGPSQLELRQEIMPSSPKVATVKHGEKLEIVQVRRRFYKVRTSAGAEGWTDERSLLSKAEIDALTSLREAGARLPPQGIASFGQRTNVHTEPARVSPSFTQIEENEKVTVLLHRVTPRVTDSTRKSLLPPPPPKVPRKKNAAKEKKHVDRKGNPLPPFPKGPPPPADWLEFSRNRTYEPEPVKPEAPAKPAGPQTPLMDEWTLVRRSNGDAGWVLRSRLMLDLPDYILQHAEGKRITSYFILGQIHDKSGAPKPVYLWTTVSSRYADYDFDLMRLFFWNTRRERYETGYIERNLRGHLPVVMQKVNAPRGSATSGKVEGLSFEVLKEDGSRRRRFYAYLGDRLRLAGEEPVQPPPSEEAPAKEPAQKPQTKEKPSWFSRFSKRIAQRLGVGETGGSPGL